MTRAFRLLRTDMRGSITISRALLRGGGRWLATRWSASCSGLRIALTIVARVAPFLAPLLTVFAPFLAAYRPWGLSFGARLSVCGRWRFISDRELPLALFPTPPVEQAADMPAGVERFPLLRVQAVIECLKLGLDCLQSGMSGLGHLFGVRHSAWGCRKIRLVSA